MTRYAFRIGVVVTLASGLAACAAQDKSAAAPKSEAYGSAAAAPQQPAPAGYPMSTPPAAPPPPPAPAQPGALPQGAEPGKPTPSRAQALQSAANEVDTSQRELDVAAGDCRNACRALGSMDRATGRLCGLTRGDSETRRCDDAKRRVYSARDRVKATCGQCENGASVDRAAPIPSLR